MPGPAWCWVLPAFAPDVRADEPWRQADGAFGFRAAVAGDSFEAASGDFTVWPRLGDEIQADFLIGGRKSGGAM